MAAMAEVSDVRMRVHANVLDHFGISAYNSLRKCLTELVVNAYDADARRVDVLIPERINQNASIQILDDGGGMSRSELENDYLFIGRDRRESSGQRTGLGRAVIGNKGIGKFAGFGVASEIHVTTVQNGRRSTLVLDRQNMEQIESLFNLSIQITEKATNDRAGTRIELKNLNAELRKPKDDVIRRHLYRALPRVADFKVFVNNVECAAEDIPGNRENFSQKIDGAGSVHGFYIIANQKQSQPGLAIRVRGRLVTEPQLFGLSARSHRLFTLDKIAGEINADFLDPEDRI